MYPCVRYPLFSFYCIELARIGPRLMRSAALSSRIRLLKLSSSEIELARLKLGLLGYEGFGARVTSL